MSASGFDTDDSWYDFATGNYDCPARVCCEGRNRLTTQNPLFVCIVCDDHRVSCMCICPGQELNFLCFVQSSGGCRLWFAASGCFWVGIERNDCVVVGPIVCMRNPLNPRKRHVGPNILQRGHRVDIGWLMVCGFRVFTMQGAFAVLETGVVRTVHVTPVMIKNLGDIVFGSCAWFFIGYGMAFADADGGQQPGGYFPSSKYRVVFPDIPDEVHFL